MKTLEKVVGWFVEAEEPGPECVASAAAPPARASEPRRTVDPPRTFAEVYEAAGIGRDEQDRVERTLELLATLPESTPLEVRRAIVEASMRAFAIPLEGMLATVDAQIAALDRHVEVRAAEGESAAIEGRARIEALEAEIAELRAVVAAEGRAKEALLAETEEEKHRVSAINAFFARR